MPSPILWNVPRNIDVATLIHKVLYSPEFLNAAWPALKLTMNTNLKNFAWTAGLATTLATAEVIMQLPRIIPALQAHENKVTNETEPGPQS